MGARRIGSAAAAGGVLALAASPIAAWADSTPAPPGQASGSAAQVTLQGAPNPVLGISTTSASDGPGSSSAGAQTVQVLGNNVGPSGTSQNGASSGSGSLASTPAGSPVQASVAQYDVSSTNPSGGSSQSSADATLAHANVGGSSGVTTDVARSQSKSSYSGSQSSGSSTSDGAVVNAGGSGGLTVDVLHSSAATNGAGANGTGTSYLLEFGSGGPGGSGSGPIGTSSDIGHICAAFSNSLIQLVCVAASGGLGTASGTVGNIVVANPGGSGSLLTALLFEATATVKPGQSTPAVLTSSSGSTAPSTGSAPGATPGGPAGSPGSPSDSPSSPAGHLPFTGFDLELIIIASGLLLTAGAAAVRISSRVPVRVVR